MTIGISPDALGIEFWPPTPFPGLAGLISVIRRGQPGLLPPGRSRRAFPLVRQPGLFRNMLAHQNAGRALRVLLDVAGDGID